MQSKATTVTQYLKELPADRRAEIEVVRTVILENLEPVFEEGMQYGMIGCYVPHRVYPPGYHCDPKQPLPFIGLASQKNHLSLYLGCAHGPEREQAFRAAWAKTGKKLDMGRACVRFKKVEALAPDVIGDSIRRTSARGFIEHYESTVQALLHQSRGSSATKQTKTEQKNRTAKSAAFRRGKQQSPADCVVGSKPRH